MPTPDREHWLLELEKLLRRKEALLAKTKSDFERSLRDVASLNRAIEKHKGRREDPAVLVRQSPGPRVEIYHSAASPCGRASNRGSFKKVLLGEALDTGLRPCSACAFWLTIRDEDVIEIDSDVLRG
jgi:hypothetical protein